MLKDDNIFFQRFRKAFDGIRVDIELGKPQNLFKLISDDLARGKHILIVLGILYLLYILYLKGAWPLDPDSPIFSNFSNFSLLCCNDF